MLVPGPVCSLNGLDWLVLLRNFKVLTFGMSDFKILIINLLRVGIRQAEKIIVHYLSQRHSNEPTI